ncbi:hypothetical protein Sste5344_006286 [Sporothrix stenoceras]
MSPLALREHKVINILSEKAPADIAQTPTCLPLQKIAPRHTAGLVVSSKHNQTVVYDIPYPKIDRPDEIIIRTKAVGLNPIDWKSVDYNFCLPHFPWIGGREVAGIVEEVGPAVTGFQVGDRVWASTYYRDRRAGTFQEFVTVPEHTVLPLPENLTFEHGACIGVAALTAAMTLWKWLQVPMPVPAEAVGPNRHSRPENNANNANNARPYLLVWGGSTVTGQFAIQLASLGGYRVIAVCSEETEPLVRDCGAEICITRDGKTNTVIVAEIRAHTQDALVAAVDLVGASTAASCLEALSTTLPASIAPLAFMHPGQPTGPNVAVANVEMKTFVLDKTSRRYAEILNNLVAQGTLHLPAIEVLRGGFQRIQEGLGILKRGQMAGRKLVVLLEDDGL